MKLDLAGQWARSIGGRAFDTVPVPGSYAPETRPAIQIELHPAYEILRLDGSIQALWAVSVSELP